MARYRKCPRPCAQGKSCKWLSKMLQQVPPLKCPYFLKNVSNFMLWRPSNPCPRLEVPADFVQGHGEKFNDMVEVRGPCKSIWYLRVNILESKHRRVMLDHGWRTLANDLGLNQGDHVLFVLTAFSKFKVYVFDDVGMRRRLSSFHASVNGINNEASPSATSVLRPRQPCCVWPKGDHTNTFHARKVSISRRPLRGEAQARAQADEADEEEEMEEGEAEAEEVETTVHEPWKRRLRGSSLARPVVVEISDDNCADPSESEYTLNGSEIQGDDTDSFQSSQRSAFQKSYSGNDGPASRAPSFIKKVPALSLKNERGPNGAHLEVPATFTQRYDDVFKEHVSLQGPTGRIWHVLCQITVEQQYKRVRLRGGWFDFVQDNMVKLHDQLLFTNVAEGQFRVQIVTKRHRRRGRPRQNYSSEGKVHQDDARMTRKDKIGTLDMQRLNFQPPDVSGEYPLKSRIHEMQQQLLALKRALYRKVEDRYARRGRKEWGLGHS